MTDFGPADFKEHVDRLLEKLSISYQRGLTNERQLCLCAGGSHGILQYTAIR